MHANLNNSAPQSFNFYLVFGSLEDRILFDGALDTTCVLPQADNDAFTKKILLKKILHWSRSKPFSRLS